MWINRNKLLLLIFVCTIVVQRVRLYDIPLHGDICAYAVLGHEMLHGRALYSDLWERKPPLLYITFAAAELVAGYGRGEVFLLGVTTSLSSLLLIYCIGRSNNRGEAAGLFAGGFWVLLNCDLELAANQTDPEGFINVFMLAAFLLMLNWPTRHRAAACLLGAILAGATLYKHNAVLVCAAMLAGNLLLPSARKIAVRLADFVIACGTLGGIWLAIIGYFAATGRLHAFADVLLHQNLSYSGSMQQNIARSFQFSRAFPLFMLWVIAPLLLVAVLLGFSFRNRSASPGRGWFLLIYWSIGTWATIALTGYIFPHYYQLYLPIGCIAGGWAAGGVLQPPARISPVIGYGTITIAIMSLLIREGGYFLLDPQEWTRRQYYYFDVARQNQLGVELKQVLQPNEQFWELGADNALYFFSGHSPPTGLLFIDPLISGDEKPAYWERLLRDLNRAPPALVILSDNWMGFFTESAPIFPWLRKQYVFWNTPLGYPHYQMLVRRGSNLALRINPTDLATTQPSFTHSDRIHAGPR